MSEVSALKIVIDGLSQVLGVRTADVASAWRYRNETGWPCSLEIYQKLGRYFLEAGELRLALDVAAEGLGTEAGRDDLLLLHTRILARLRIGELDRALAELDEQSDRIARIDADDLRQEMRGLVARARKDAWEITGRADLLRRAFETYRDSYRETLPRRNLRDKTIWTGINAATLAYHREDSASAEEIAARVRDICLELLTEKGAIRDGQLRIDDPLSMRDHYWTVATLAEAELLVTLLAGDDLEGPAALYRTAASLARESFANLLSTRRNLKLILGRRFGDKARARAEADRMLPMPPVVVFAGHMVDTPSRPAERFPAELAPRVKEAIRECLASLSRSSGQTVHFGFASGACGSDILFHEVLGELEGESHVVLPYDLTAFKTDSVDIVGEGDWGERLDRVLDRAAERIYASDHRLAHGTESYDYVNALLLGLARMKARELDMDLFGVAVWEEGDPGGPGGTASNIRLWREAGIPREAIRIIDVRRLREPDGDAGTEPSRVTGLSLPAPAVTDSKIKALLFSDIRGFSRLNEGQLPVFVNGLLRDVAELCDSDEFKDTILVRNSWGDAIYLVFETVRDAGRFAVRLHDTVHDFVERHNRRHPDERFPEEFDIRTGLHVGPVHFAKADPITGLPNYYGTHVCRGARIEPIARPGQIYTSREFAALAAVEGVDEFVFEYVGQQDLAKGYGRFETYLLRRVAPAD